MSGPQDFYEPTPAELKARKKRNYTIALLLIAFIGFVVFAVLSRGVIMTYPDIK